MKKIFTLIALTAFGLFSLIQLANAQALGAAVTVDTLPHNPVPGDIVTVTVTSYSTDLTQANFTWIVDGVTQKQGKGIASYQITAPGLGLTRQLQIVIDTKNIGVVTERVLIAPAAVDIVADANSYVPPFYKGAALPSVQGQVKLVALPNFVTASGRKLSSQEITFKWKVNTFAQANLSGVGKNTFTIQEPFLPGQGTTIEVDASSPENNLTAHGIYVAAGRQPQIIFYEDNPLRGILFNKALSSNYSLSGDELTLVAYPYFFDKNIVYDPKSIFTWQINGADVTPTGSTQNVLTVRRPEGQSGSSEISLSVKNSGTVFQSTDSNILVNFGGTAGTVHF